MIITFGRQKEESAIPYPPYLSLCAIGLAMVAMFSIVYASWRNGISPMPASAAVR